MAIKLNSVLVQTMWVFAQTVTYCGALIISAIQCYNAVWIVVYKHSKFQPISMTFYTCSTVTVSTHDVVIILIIKFIVFMI